MSVCSVCVCVCVCVQLLISFVSGRFLCAVINWCVRLWGCVITKNSHAVRFWNWSFSTWHSLCYILVSHHTEWFSTSWLSHSSCQNSRPLFRSLQFVTVCLAVRQMTASWATWVHALLLQNALQCYSPHLCLNLSSGFLICVSQLKKMNIFFLCPCMLHVRPITLQLLVQTVTLVIMSLLPLSSDAPQHRYQKPAVSILWQCLSPFPREIMCNNSVCGWIYLAYGTC